MQASSFSEAQTSTKDTAFSQLNQPWQIGVRAHSCKYKVRSGTLGIHWGKALGGLPFLQQPEGWRAHILQLS